MITIRLRTRISKTEIDSKVGKILTDDDYNVLLSGPAKVLKPNGDPLCVYLPGKMTKHFDDENIYGILHGLRNMTTRNRGLASGTKRVATKTGQHSYSREIASSTIGAMDATGRYKYCRLTAWTGQNVPHWQELHPLLKDVASALKEYVPDRYEAQADEADRSKPEWVVPGTPFTTVTVNNSYPTGVHTDKGDLEKGFSTIACVRKGSYTGGRLCFPEWRVALDLKHGDLICMDAHDWHGNTMLVCQCGENMNGPCRECGDERISIVSYFRENITECGTADEEYDKATQLAESRTNKTLNKQG